MQSEATAVPDAGSIDRVAKALSPRFEAFRSTVAEAEAELRAYVSHQRGLQSFMEEQILVELGPFAIGRIDSARFAQLLGQAEDPLEPEAFDVLSRADSVLAALAASSDVPRAVVPPGGDLRDEVKAALARAGRVFGASRAVEAARSGRYADDAHGPGLHGLPFHRWNAAERTLAPPLIVEVRGEDCRPQGLAEFLDGRVSLVLVVSGPCTPAPLARLVSPGTVVVQTADPEDLALLGDRDGPAVGLLFDEDLPGQAHFVHDPDGGSTPGERLRVSQWPEEPVVGRGRRPPSWVEDVEHLRALSAAAAPTGAVQAARTVEAGSGAPLATNGSAPDDTAGQLAAWILAQTDLPDG